MSYPTILLRTVLAVLIGGLVGMERQSKRRPAGFRTHILVCLGSATVMVLSEYLFISYHEAYGITPDPARLGAQVISGVGFLGAGTIIHSGANIRGLTTAASLWATAAVGLVIGAGFYALAVTVAVVLFITLEIFDRITELFEKSSRIMEVIVTMDAGPAALGDLSYYFGSKNIKVTLMSFLSEASAMEKEGASSCIHVSYTLKLPPGLNQAAILTDIAASTGVKSAELV